MIITLTANPSLDRTIELGAPLAHGAVQRAVGAVQDPGGKGVNISRALQVSGVPTLAIVPGEATDPVLTALQAVDVEFANLPTGEPIRSNITVVDPDGTTTKLNAPGTVFDAELRQKLDELVVERSKGADWVVLAGSLPPGLEPTHYSELVAARPAPGARALTADLDEDTVDFAPNYDYTLTEPEVLPAAFPNLLVNGPAGIAGGMATNMPPPHPRHGRAGTEK